MERTKTGSKELVILSCDPSLTAFGYVVIKDSNILECGCIKTAPTNKKLRIRKSDDRVNRISEINQVLKSVLIKHQVNFIVSELPHGSQSAVAAIALGMIAGAVQAMADFRGLAIEWFSEADSKKMALGKQSAEKEEMIRAMSIEYGCGWKTSIKYRDEAVADALAVYHCAMIKSPTIKFLSK